MRVPTLNRSLTLEAPQSTPDGAGGYVLTWSALGTLWADVRPGNGQTRAIGETTVSRVPLIITVRSAVVGSDARPVAGQRLRDGARLFAVLAVTERDPSGRFLTCHATEEVIG
ncbi:head-tail adaptor protein [Loktanella sp. SALINAS62]|uniref:head-tail adaptor protein n=1 Tax=Loktanella sp. SALINAS62 TaxID=2706124 RepID=UPI001B8D2625|nr:head-tail adaptor protein [Loktanella sp. SALINAS62]MBS1303592.1 head-tail adaptor protein [Loktanella sp. SALINAS62]